MLHFNLYKRPTDAPNLERLRQDLENTQYVHSIDQLPEVNFRWFSHTRYAGPRFNMPLVAMPPLLAPSWPAARVVAALNQTPLLCHAGFALGALVHQLRYAGFDIITERYESPYGGRAGVYVLNGGVYTLTDREAKAHMVFWPGASRMQAIRHTHPVAFNATPV